MNDQATTQAIVVPDDTLDENTKAMRLALFNEDGTPFDVSGDLDTTNAAVTALQALPFAVAVVTATAIGTAAKTTTTPEPRANSFVVVKFTNGNSAASPTLAFNGGTARAMQLGGVASASAKLTVAATGVAAFWFDGTILHQLGTVA